MHNMNAREEPASDSRPPRHLTVRNLPAQLATELVRERHRRGASMNQTVIDLLSASLGLEKSQTRSNGLSKLAGGWSAKDLREFEEATADFEHVDDELWK